MIVEDQKVLMDQDREGKNKLAANGIPSIETELQTNREKGLEAGKIASLQAQYGKNALTAEEKEPIWKVFLDEFKSFVVIMLLAAAILCLALKVWYDGIAILVIVIGNACLGTYMSVSAGNALEALAKMTAPTCTVVRDGKADTIDAAELVPGDVVIVKTGDQTPADIRMFEVNELLADEAPLTGESEPVHKCLAPEDLDAAFSKNMCFAATLITNGQGRGIVVKTGMTTEVGKIAEGVKQKKTQTPLQKGLDRLGGQIGAMAGTVLIGIIIFAWLVDYDDPAHPNMEKLLKLIIMGVTFAVSAIPEGLPMVVTICLSVGCKDMVARKAQVRKLPAVETLGSCNVICSDKTGTLTEGKMTLIRMATFIRSEPGEETIEESLVNANSNFFRFWPTKRFDPNGGCFAESALNKTTEEQIIKLYQSGDLTKHRRDQTYDEVLPDYGNPDGPLKDDLDAHALRATMLAAYLNSYETKIAYDTTSTMFETKGNMSEAAIVVGAAKCRFFHDDDSVHQAYARIKDFEIPFSSSRKMASTVHKLPEVNKFGKVDLSGEDDVYTHAAVVKGAPDRLFPFVKYMLYRSTEDSCLKVDWSAPMSHLELTEAKDVNGTFSEDALRVLAVCVRYLTDADVEELKKKGDATDRLDYILGTGEQGSLVLHGLLGSLDPPRAGVQEAVETCRSAGVRVIMITGDQKNTAVAIAKNLSILQHGDTIEEKAIACADLHHEDGSLIERNLLDQITYRVNVFARAQPEDKMAIVESLQGQGCVCAMTGDGVNDAPALKKADIGIGMGKTGTDVAKGASDMVLMDDNFCSIVAAVEEGRKIYANIQKFVCFLLGTNIGEIFYLSIAVLADLPLPVFGIQVLFLNLFTDGGPAVALTMEPADKDVMQKPPRNKKANIMTRDCMLWINMPHQVGIAIAVIGVTITAMYMHTGAIQQSKIVTLCEYMTDSSWPAWSKDDCVSDTSCPYYCMCQRWDGSMWVDKEDGKAPYAIQHEGANDTWVRRSRDPIEDTSYFGGGSVTREIRRRGWTFEEWKNRTRYEVVFATNDDPPKWPLSTVSTIQRLHVSNGVWLAEGMTSMDPDEPNGPTVQFKRDAKIIKDNCMTHGVTLGRSTAFITAVMCEMLRAYTVRSHEAAYKVFFRNNWMHIACLVSFTCTVMLTIIPGVKIVFALDNPTWFYYFVAFGFAFSCMMHDEFWKILYRRKMIAAGTESKAGFERRIIRDRVECIVEMLHNVNASNEKNEDSVYDIKEHLGRLEADLAVLKETSGGMTRTNTRRYSKEKVVSGMARQTSGDGATVASSVVNQSCLPGNATWRGVI